MGQLTAWAFRIGGKLAALACGIATGSALAVAIAEDGPGAWLDSVWLAGWLMAGSKLGPGEGDDIWLLQWEWSVAVRIGCYIALVCSVTWALITWRRLNTYRAAALLGFVATMPFALAFFNDDGSPLALLRCALIGCAGAIAGIVTLKVDKVLSWGARRRSPAR